MENRCFLLGLAEGMSLAGSLTEDPAETKLFQYQFLHHLTIILHDTYNINSTFY